MDPFGSRVLTKDTRIIEVRVKSIDLYKTANYEDMCLVNTDIE